MRKSRKQRSKSRGPVCTLEALEGRELLAAGVVNIVVTSGAMTITGDNTGDHAISISQPNPIDDGNFTITGLNGTTVKVNGGAGAGSQSVASVTGNITIDFSLGGNNSVVATGPLYLIDATGAHSLTYKGGAGNDSLFKSTSATGMVAFMSDPTTDEVQSLSVGSTPTSGTYTLSYNGNQTVALNYNDSLATVEGALQALPGLSSVTVTGTTLDAGGPMNVAFNGMSGIQPLLVVGNNTLDDGSGPVSTTVSAQTPYTGLGTAATGSITISDTAGSAAAGTLSFVNNLIAGDRLTLNDGAGNVRTYTAVSGAPVAGSGQFRIGGTKIITMTNLVNAINNASPVLGITATDNLDGTCALANDVNGAAGNRAIVVSTFSATRITATGMTGGGISNVSPGDTVTLSDGMNTPTVFTFGSGAGQVAIGGTAAITAANLIAAINAVGNTLLVTASDGGSGVVNLIQDAPGADGNTTITKSGAQIAKTNFTGGLDGTNVQDGDQIMLDDGIHAPITFTARASSPGANEFLISGDPIRTMANFVAAVNAASSFNITATDNADGTCTVTNRIPGTFGNTTASVSGSINVAFSVQADGSTLGMDGGTGYALDALSVSATMGEGNNTLGIGAGGSGQSAIFGDVTYTGGAGNDTVAIRGAFIAGNVSATLGAGDNTTGDSFSIADEGSVASSIGGNLTVTHTTGLSTMAMQNDPSIAGSLNVTGNVTLSTGNAGTATSLATFQNIRVDGTFSYTGGASPDDVEFLNGADIGGTTTINLGAGANVCNSVGTQEVQTLTPDAGPTGGTFTLTYDGHTTAAIAYDATLAQIQTAARLLPGLEGVVVSGTPLVGIPEVQTLVATVAPASGTYTLTFGVKTTAALNYNDDAATIQAALVTATITGVTVTGSLDAGTVTFTFTASQGDVAMMSIDPSSLDQTSAGNYVWTEQTQGVAAPADMIFTFPAAAGHASLITANESLATTTSLSVVETTAGSDFEFGTLAPSLAAGLFTYTGGAATDDVSLGGRIVFDGAATFVLGTTTPGDGDNTLAISNVSADGTFTVTGGTGGDAVDIGATSYFDRANFTTNLGAGANSLTMANATLNGFSCTGGANDDTVTLGTTAFNDAGVFTLVLSDGTNQLTMPNAKITGNFGMTGGTGDDTATVGSQSFVSSGTVSFNLGTAGTNAVTLDGSSRAVTYGAATAAGTNTLTMGTRIGSGGYTAVGSLTFTTANTATANTLNFDGNLVGLLYTGTNNADTLNLGVGAAKKFVATGYVSVTALNGANTLTMKNADIRGADTTALANGLVYVGGTGDDVLTIGDATTPGARVAKGVSITLGTASTANSVNINNSNFNAGSGAFNLTGSTGVDNVAIDAGGGGTTFNRATNITGGGGADVLTDVARVGNVGTFYAGATAATKLTVTGFRANGATINGVLTTGTVNGKTIIAPVYA